jgi:hypothetical protein
MSALEKIIADREWLGKRVEQEIDWGRAEIDTSRGDQTFTMLSCLAV